jgi:dTDP-D-glucose 4,6-dehydratase
MSADGMRDATLMSSDKSVRTLTSCELRLSEKPYERLITYVADQPGLDQRYAIDAQNWRPSSAGALRRPSKQA